MSCQKEEEEYCIMKIIISRSLSVDVWITCLSASDVDTTQPPYSGVHLLYVPLRAALMTAA